MFLFILTLVITSNCYAQSDTFDSDTELIIDEYKLNTKLFLENEKEKFEIDSICLDLFDFKVLKSYIHDTEKNCHMKIQNRDKLCSENIVKIQHEHDKVIESYKLEYNVLLEEKNKIKIKLITSKKLNDEKNTFSNNGELAA